jgi:hypothetical protein
MVQACGLSKRVWLGIFFCLHICSFGFLVGAMNYGTWMSQTIYSDGEFKGGLLSPKDTSDDYKTLKDRYCGDSGLEALCDEYGNFYSAGVAYVFFDVIGSILVAFIVVIVVLEFLEVKSVTRFLSLKLSMILSLVITFLHFLAFVIWAGVVKLKYNDCDLNTGDTDAQSVCGEGGSALAIWTIFYLIFFSIFYFVVCKKIIIEEKTERGEPLR